MNKRKIAIYCTLVTFGVVVSLLVSTSTVVNHRIFFYVLNLPPHILQLAISVLQGEITGTDSYTLTSITNLNWSTITIVVITNIMFWAPIAWGVNKRWDEFDHRTRRNEPQ